MIDLDREIRAVLEEDARRAPPVPEARQALRQTRRRQVGVVLTALAMVAAVAVGSFAGVSALMRSAPTPAEPPDRFSPGALEAVASQPVSFEGLIADVDGALWSRGPGVTRFDPASGSFRTFTVADDPAFSLVSVLVPAREGGVWMYSYNEQVIRRFDGDRIRETSALAPGWVGDIAEGPDGTIWASGGGVYSWNGGSWVEAPSEERPTTEAGEIAVDTAGNVWVENVRYPGPEFFGVSRFDGVRWTTFTTQEVFPFDDVPSGDADRGAIETIVPGLDGDVWVGGRGGVAHFADGAWTSYESSAFGLEYVTSIAVNASEVWVGGGGTRERRPPSIARFDGTTWTRVVEGLDGFGGRYEYTQIVATQEGIWAVTNSTLYRLEGSRWQPIVANERPASAWPIAAAGADELWTGPQGVWRLQGDRWTHFDESDGVPGGHVNDLAVAGDGTVWVATKEGLAAFDGTRWELVAPGAHTAIALGPGGEVWTASRGAEDWTIRPVGGTALPPLGGLVAVSRLAVGPAGDVWAGSAPVWGTGGGLAHFDGEIWQMVEPVVGAHASVWDVEATQDGDVWVLAAIPTVDEQGIGGAEPYIARYHDGAWTTFGEGDGIPTEPLEVEVAPDGHLLLLGSEGLFVLRDGTWDLLQDGDFRFLSVALDETVWLAGFDSLFRLPNA